VTGPAVEEGETARQVELDWDGLMRALLWPAPGAEAYLDVLTGEIVALVDGWSDDHAFSEQELAEGLATGRLLAIEPLPREMERGFMRTFAAGLPDGWARDALQEALGSAAPMRGFGEALGRFPRERLEWLSCHERHLLASVAAWLETNSIEPTTVPRRGGILR
jgi:hypothetical protein